MIPIHIVTAFYRKHLLDKIIRYYESMNIIWHPVIFKSEKVDWPDKEWIRPYFISDNKDINNEIGIEFGYYKNNAFIRSGLVNDNDYYMFLDDDDMITEKAIKSLKVMDDDVIFISLKRGHYIPKIDNELKRYETHTLLANPHNVCIGSISKQQIVTKGKIFKRLNFIQNIHYADGILAVWLKQNHKIRYEPQLYALLNYFEPGRWRQ